MTAVPTPVIGQSDRRARARLQFFRYVLLSALLLSAAMLAILLASGRPIFYRQERAGQGGVPFMILKLRTMVQDAEKLEIQVIEGAAPGTLIIDTEDESIDASVAKQLDVLEQTVEDARYVRNT